MTRKQTKKAHAHSHEQFAAVALALIALATLAGADLFSAPETQSVAHANTSANPYQPVRTYVPSNYPSYEYRTQPVQSSVSSLPRAAVLRKIKALERSMKTISRQLQNAERKIDTLTAALENAKPANTIGIRSALEDLEALRDRLEQRLADTNTKLEGYRLQLQ